MYVWIERLFSTGMVIFYELRRKQSTERMSVVIYKVIQSNVDALQFVNHTLILKKKMLPERTQKHNGYYAG